VGEAPGDEVSNPGDLGGVLPVFQTPWRDDESLNVDVLEREINWLFDRGADGVVMAMVSEVLRMSSQERRAIAEVACEFGRRRGAVVISVAAASAKLAEQHAIHAEQCADQWSTRSTMTHELKSIGCFRASSRRHNAFQVS
jgi:hypothetical protein